MQFAAILFWILMALWLIGGVYWNRNDRSPVTWGTALLPWLCLALLGFIVTGNPFTK